MKSSWFSLKPIVPMYTIESRGSNRFYKWGFMAFMISEKLDAMQDEFNCIWILECFLFDK